MSECKRTYPLDPNSAEDPCEDCGRDERKHEIGPRAAPPIAVRKPLDGKDAPVPQLVVNNSEWAAPPSIADWVDGVRVSKPVVADGLELLRPELGAPPSPDEKLSANVCRHDGFSHTRNVDCPKKE